MLKIKLRKKREIIDQITQPFEEFFRAEASSGILLIVTTVIAMVLANSPVAGRYFEFWETKIGFSIGDFTFKESLLHWINDGLMAIFFFMVGLEIKREIMIGELASVKQAMLPISAAIGGMIIPALFYLIFNDNTSGEPGWGIPMATDIAFALGILMLLGKRAPLSLKIFLTALAIVDDLGAVIVIAVFYTTDIHIAGLLIGAGILALLIITNWIGIRHPLIYGILGIALWFAFLESGIHTTVAGVLAALTIPARTRIDGREFVRKTKFLLDRFQSACSPKNLVYANQMQQETLQTLEIICHHTESPMQRMEHDLRPWVIYFIVPVFALANAGIPIPSNIDEALSSSVSIGIIAGLLLGKPIGISLFTWLVVKTKIAVKPHDVKWIQIIGVSFLAGIGFTMSLFIDNLAFTNSPFLVIAKIAILTASLAAGIIGWIILASQKNKYEKDDEELLKD